MRFAVLLALAAFGVLLLFSIYKLFARTPDRHDASDSRFGPGPDDNVGGAD